MSERADHKLPESAFATDHDSQVRDSAPASALAAALSALATPKRDIRIDFLRGLALIVIFIDHTTETYRAAGGHHYYLPTLRDFGLCSAAEFFFFLSGYVFAMVHARIMDQRGVVPSLGKALRRALQIYAANVLIFVAVAAIAAPLSSRPEDYLQFTGLWLLRDQAPMAIWRFLTLRYLPAYTDILPLYVLFVVLAPFVLLAIRRLTVPTLIASVAVYIAAGWLPGITFPLNASVEVQWGLNPLSWQLLFVAGMALGSPAGKAAANSPARGSFRRTIAWGIGVLLVMFAVAKAVAGAAKLWSGSDWPTLHRLFALPGLGVANVGPVRLAYFVTLLFVVFQLVPPSAWFERKKWPQPFIDCGSRSLTIFAASTALTQFVALSMLRVVHGYILFLACIATSSVAILSLGVLLCHRARERGRRHACSAEEGRSRP